jgi:putative ABC transport system permease protein
MPDRFFRVLLRLLPEELRAAYGREIETTFRDERRAAGAGRFLVLTGIWLSTVADLLRQAPVQHWEVLVRDVRYAGRMMARRRLHAAAAIVTLALAIGANVAMFAVVDAVLIAPLPYGDSSRAVIVLERSAGREPGPTGYLTFEDVRARSRVFTALAAASQSFATLSGDGGDPERLHAVRVSASYFDVAGVRPAIGRPFSAAEDKPGDARLVAVLSDGLWRRRFNADPSVIGRTILLSDRPFRVVGIMPAAFHDLVAQRLYDGAELWTPLGYDPSADFACRTCRHLRVFGRLAPSVTPAAAEADVNGLLRVLSREHPAEYDRPSARVQRLSDFFLGPVRRVLLVLWGGVGLLLIVACVNVANLLLMRASERRREVAIRAALGVTRGRLLRQLLTEALLLATAGGLAGLAPAWVAIRLVARTGPAQFPRLANAALDGRALLAACVLSAVSAVVFGLVPLRHLRRCTLADAMHGSAGRGEPPATWRVRAALGAANVAIAAMLLVGAGVLVRSMLQLLAVTPGFDPDRVLTTTVDLAGARYRSGTPAEQVASVTAYYETVLARLRSLPGVAAASATATLPLGGGLDRVSLHIAGRLHANPEEAPDAERFAVTPGFFDALHIPLIRGRCLDARDGQGAPLAAVINRTAADALFPDEDPIGHELMLGPPSAPRRTIVGIAGDVRNDGLDAPAGLQVYVPQAQWPWAETTMTLVVRASPEVLTSLGASLRQTVRDVDAAQALSTVEPYDAIVGRSFATRRFASWLLVSFAAVAVVLALVGLYGAIGVMVGLRQREIGVRLALGAGAGRVRRMVLAQGMRPALVGLVAGLALAWWAVASLRPLVFQLDARDPATFACTATFLLAAALAACLVPARRAARVDPAITLRTE